jgi:uncharacterized protein (DUF1015 family)
MADVRPLKGLRYQADIAGDLGSVIAPPYDVISEETQRALYDRGPYNVVRLEYALEEASRADGSDRYQTAADTLAGWMSHGVLAADSQPHFYLYEQTFHYEDREYRRRAIIGRVRLEPWEAGVVLPHEHTLAGPKEDRLRLLEACRTDISPVFALYRPDGGRSMSECELAASEEPAIDAIDISGQRHRLWIVDDPAAIERLTAQFATRTLYIADGHHRYETALNYRDERRAAAGAWTGDEAENFVLLALTAADDPGLLILPIHRLVRPYQVPPTLEAALEESFKVRVCDWDQGGGMTMLMDQLAEEGVAHPAFGCLGFGERPIVISLRNTDAIERLMPPQHSVAWRYLGVNVLQYGIFEPLLGINLETVRTGDRVTFTESAEEARQLVESGRYPLAFLLNATRPDEIFAVADAGDRMPQKSTYFYPKLGTGLVLYAMDA